MAVVFIHGVLSDEGGWRHKNGTFWPDVLLQEPSISGAGIYVFEYETGFFSGNFSLGDVVASLRTHMRLDKIQDCNTVVFVCHSMGGIVARRYVVQNQVDLIDRSTTVGLFLIASPSLGSDYARWLAPLARRLQHTQADVLRFSQTNTWLNDLDEDFMNLKERGSLRMFGKELVEDKFIILKGLIRRQVVPAFSGNRYFGDALKIPGSDHFSIAKIGAPAEMQNRLLIEFLQTLIARGEPSASGEVINLGFEDDLQADTIQCRIAVERLCRTDDPVAILWPKYTEEMVSDFVELHEAVPNYSTNGNPFHGIRGSVVADIASSMKLHLLMIEAIRKNADAGVRRLARGMTPYWPDSWDTVIGRAIRNYMTICNVEMLRGMVAVLLHKGLAYDRRPEQLTWLARGTSQQVYAQLFDFEEPACSPKLAVLSGQRFDGGRYFWGPTSEVLMDAQRREGDAICTSWFSRYLIPQNEFHQTLIGSDLTFSYDEQLTIIKVLNEDGDEIY